MTELRLLGEPANKGICELPTGYAAIAARCDCGIVHYGLMGLAFTPDCCGKEFPTRFIRKPTRDSLLEELERIR